MNTQTKHATPTKIVPKGANTTAHGTTYGFWIEMDNGDTGFYNSKSEHQTKFVVGTATDYELETHAKKDGQGEWHKIKPVYQQGGFGGRKDSAGMRVGMCINNAVKAWVDGKIEKEAIQPFAAWLNDIAKELEGE